MKNSRIFASASVAIVSLFALTGCMSISANVVLNDEGSAGLSYALGYDKEVFSQLMEQGGSVDPEESLCTTIERSMNEDQISDTAPIDGTWSETETECVLTVDLENVPFDETGAPLGDDLGIFEGLNVKSVGNDAKVTFDVASLEELFAAENGVTMEQMLSRFEFNVTFPGEVLEASNAAAISEDGKTLTWNLDAVEDSIETGTDLEATGVISEAPSVLLITGIALGALVLIGGAIVIVRVRSAKKSSL